jgi:hypothetical protein
MSRLCSGVYSRKTKKSMSPLSLFNGRLAISVFAPEPYDSGTCSVPYQYKESSFLSSGKCALYPRISLPDMAAATIAETLNVFLLFGLPTEALKLPRVAMVAPPHVMISGGNAYSSVTLSLMCFNSLFKCLLVNSLIA